MDALLLLLLCRYRDGCDFLVVHHSAKVGSNERGESIHMPRIDVARAALLLSDASPKQVRKWLGRTGLDRNEKTLVNTGLRALRAFPTSEDSVQVTHRASPHRTASHSVPPRCPSFSHRTGHRE